MSGTERSVIWAADRPVPIGVAEPAAEEWRPIPGWPTYEVSNLGRVLTHRVGRGRPPRIMKGTEHNGGGYRVVNLGSPSGKRVLHRVHRLVLLAFVGPEPEGCVLIRHLDGDPTNNRIENLAYGTYAENGYDVVLHGRHYNAAKTHCPAGHEYSVDNTYVYPTQFGKKRQCRTCAIDRSREQHALLREAS